MLINITGVKQTIESVGQIPPIYNYDATETEVRRLVHAPNYRVYESSTGRLITLTNVDSFFTNSSGSGGSTTGGGVNWKVLG